MSSDQSMNRFAEDEYRKDKNTLIIVRNVCS